MNKDTFLEVADATHREWKCLQKIESALGTNIDCSDATALLDIIGVVIERELFPDGLDEELQEKFYSSWWGVIDLDEDEIFVIRTNFGEEKEITNHSDFWDYWVGLYSYV